MKETDPIKKLDRVLELLSDNKTHRIGDLKSDLEKEGIPYLKEELEIALLKLEKDGFIVILREPEFHRPVHYTITLDGYLFQGYVKQLKQDRVTNRNDRIRSFFLTWGTVLAGIAALALLLWQIYVYFYPVPTLNVFF